MNLPQCLNIINISVFCSVGFRGGSASCDCLLKVILNVNIWQTSLVNCANEALDGAV